MNDLHSVMKVNINGYDFLEKMTIIIAAEVIKIMGQKNETSESIKCLK